MDHAHIRRRQFLGASLGLSAAGVAGAAFGADAAEKPAAANEAEAAKPPEGTSWEKNEVIQSARAAAIEILKPSKKDLEHGLKLHADSLVFETYGFAPRAPIRWSSRRTGSLPGRPSTGTRCAGPSRRGPRTSS